MKKSILFLLVIVSAFAKAQVSSSCNVPPLLATEYHKDIVQLATNYLFQIQSPDTIYVRPPQQTVDEISGGLAAILNASSIPESDSVFNLYCVHDFNGWPFDYAGFLVKVDTSYSWTQAWQNLITITGNTYLDSITSQYALHVSNFYNWSIGCYAELTVDSAWNIMALMDSIAYTPGVLSAEQNGMIGEAGWIEYHKSGSDRYYDFYFEFNDCFDGCDNYHRWSFKVDSSCSVYYLGFYDWGVFGISPLPLPINCNIFDEVKVISENTIEIFPNPVDEKLFVNCYSLFGAAVEISIYNMVGVAVQSELKNQNSEMSVDVSLLLPGIYFLEAGNSEKIFRTKFIKPACR